MASPFPPIEPYAQGMLDVGDGQSIYWETSGNPQGKPAVMLHGGPGGGGGRGSRQAFDPSLYRIILFDQRGSGQSTPHASDPGASMAHVTTDRLVADMEALRTFLGVRRWLLFGGSWGCTLALAYAERHPERVSEIVLAAISTSRRSEIDWLYRGVRRFFPEAWQRFRAGVPEAATDTDLVAAYSRRMESTVASVRTRAALDWAAWENSVLSLEGARATPLAGEATPDLLAFVRICAHVYAHAAWLEEGALLRDVGRLRSVPAVLVHGRLDLSCPVDTAWELARAWPGSRLVVIDDAGHRANEAMGGAVYAALDGFART